MIDDSCLFTVLCLESRLRRLLTMIQMDSCFWITVRYFLVIVWLYHINIMKHWQTCLHLQ